MRHSISSVVGDGKWSGDREGRFGVANPLGKCV